MRGFIFFHSIPIPSDLNVSTGPWRLYNYYCVWLFVIIVRITARRRKCQMQCAIRSRAVIILSRRARIEALLLENWSESEIFKKILLYVFNDFL